jgi:glycosyltransferase involved in cell wall biosynthesis
MSKILLITPFFSDPQVSGGSIRVKNILKQIGLNHDVHCLYFRDQLDETAKAKEFFKDGIKYSFWPNRVSLSKMSIFKKLSVEIKAILERKSLKGPIQYPLAPVKDKLRRLVQEGDYDFVIVEFTWLSEFIEFLKNEFPDLKLIVDSHNVEFYYDQQEVKNLPVLKRPFAKLFASFLSVEEKTSIGLSDQTFCVSQTDMDLYCKLIGADPEKMQVAPNGVDVASYTDVSEHKDIQDFDLIFVGWMRYPPNIRSAKFIIEKVLPKLPEATTLAIVGGDPPQEIKDLANDKIFVSGTVDDVKPYLQKAKVFVAPIFEGSGTRLKILEAFAAGKPIVCSDKAAEGIDYKDGENIFIAKSADEFSDKITGLLKDAELYSRVSKAGKALSSKKYDWAVTIQPIVSFIEDNFVNRGQDAQKIINQFAKKLYFKSQADKIPDFSLVISTSDRCPNPPGSKNEGLNTLVACFRSILDQDCLPCEVIFVNDSKLTAPNDYTSEFIKIFVEELDKKGFKHFISKRQEDQDSNTAISRNRGLKLCTTNFVYFIDDDIIFPPKSMRAAIELFSQGLKREKNLAIVDLPQNHRASIPYKIATKDYFESLDLGTLNLNRNVASTAVQEYLVENPPMEDDYLRPLSLKNFQGGNLIARKDVLESIGGFVDFKTEVSYAEETGLAFKLTEKGYKIYYYPYIDIGVCHLQQGNHSGKNKLIGPDFLAEKGEKITLAELVKESDKPRVFQTGCRVVPSYYIYMKLRNNYLALGMLGNQHAFRWEQISFEKFVKQNDQSFVDNREIDLDYNGREKLWKMAIGDAKEKRARSVKEVSDNFGG